MPKAGVGGEHERGIIQPMDEAIQGRQFSINDLDWSFSREADQKHGISQWMFSLSFRRNSDF